MIPAIAHVVWRAALLVVLGLVPWAAPLEARTSATATTGAAIVRLVLVALALALVVHRVRRSRDAWAIANGIALAAVAALLSSTFSGDRGPLARGAWVVSPIAWLFVASLVRGVAAKWRVLAAVGACGVSLLLARPRLAPIAHVWSEVHAADAGNEPAALAVAAEQRASGDRPAAFATLRTCVDESKDNCRCAENAACDAIDVGDYAAAKTILDATGACEATWPRVGALAEARVGSGEIEGGLVQADWVLRQKNDEPRSVYARGWAMWIRGDGAGALPWVKRAVDLGRGVPAQVLLGTILYQQGDIEGARGSFHAALESDPKNVRATYDLALIAQQQGQYHDAREGYLAALKLDPAYIDARYNLALLTHQHGAQLEAEHHFQELARIAPNDPRVAQLRAILDTPVR